MSEKVAKLGIGRYYKVLFALSDQLKEMINNFFKSLTLLAADTEMGHMRTLLKDRILKSCYM